MPVTWPPWSITEFGDGAHQADRAAAIDQPDIVFGQDLAKAAGRFDEIGIATGAGAAIDANCFDLAHAVHVARAFRSVKASIPSFRSRLLANSAVARARRAMPF